MDEFCNEAKIKPKLKLIAKKSIDLYYLKCQLIANSMHKGLINAIPFFENKDKVLIANLVPLLLPIKINANDFVYHKGEFPNYRFFYY